MLTDQQKVPIALAAKLMTSQLEKVVWILLPLKNLEDLCSDVLNAPMSIYQGRCFCTAVHDLSAAHIFYPDISWRELDNYDLSEMCQIFYPDIRIQFCLTSGVMLIFDEVLMPMVIFYVHSDSHKLVATYSLLGHFTPALDWQMATASLVDSCYPYHAYTYVLNFLKWLLHSKDVKRLSTQPSTVI